MNQSLLDTLIRVERKLHAYVGVCKGDKELTDTVLPMVRDAIAELEKAEPYCYIYEFDTPYGVHRSTTYELWNGQSQDRTIKLYLHPSDDENLREDTMRYRWIRQYPIGIRQWDYYKIYCKELDAAIDAAAEIGRAEGERR